MNRPLTFVLMLFFSLQLATAANAEWVVERVSSSVWASPGGVNWRDVRQGERLPVTTWIQTGERGQVILARGSERIVFRPGSIATLESHTGGTKVKPLRGSVLLSIDPNRGDRTVVETPHLAAVVLGTVFEVTANPGISSSVRVDQGRVKVEHGGRNVVLERGQEGVVPENTPRRITIQPAQVTSVVPSGSGMTLATGTLAQRSQRDIRSTPRANNSDDNDRRDRNSDDHNTRNDNDNDNDNNGNGNGNNGNGKGNCSENGIINSNGNCNGSGNGNNDDS